MVDILDKDNQHLFLEDEETDGGSFIANVNKIANNIIPIQELSKQLSPEAIAKLKEIIESVEEVGGKLSVTADNTTTARTLSARFADIVNVKDFGAVGNAEKIEQVLIASVPKPLVVVIAGQSNAVGSSDVLRQDIVVTGSYYWNRKKWVSPVQDPVTPAVTSGWVPMFTQQLSNTCNRPIYIINVAVGGTNCASKFQSTNGSWGNTGTLRARSENIVAEALAAMPMDYDVLGTIWIQGESDATHIFNGKESLTDFTLSVSEVRSWALEKFGGQFFISKLSYLKDNRYDTQIDTINDLLHTLATTTSNCFIASERAVTFRDEGYLRDTYHYTQEGYNILGESLAAFCSTYAESGVTTDQKEIVYVYIGENDSTAFEMAAASMKNVFVPAGTYNITRPIAGNFFCLGDVNLNTQHVTVTNLLDKSSYTEHAHEYTNIFTVLNSLKTDISTYNYILEDIYKQRVLDGTNTRMITVQLNSAKDAKYNQPGAFEGVYSEQNLTSDPETDPLHIDDAVLVGTPWGMSKERYLPNLRCVINAQRIYGAYNKENPAETGFGYWYSPVTEAKWQGNTTVATGKKSFTLKLDRAVEIVSGWGARKKYVIKNNIPNSPHTNLLLAKLWGDVVKTDFDLRDAEITDKLRKLTNCGAIDGLPCVYSVNGQYYGLGSLNTPKDEHLFDIAGDAIDWMIGAGSNNRQLYVLLTNTAIKAHQENENIIDKVIGQYEDFSGLMGTLRRWCPSNQSVFPVFASYIKKALLEVSGTDPVEHIQKAVQKAIDESVEYYKKLFNEGSERDSSSLSKFYMHTVYNARCQSAVWLRDLIMTNMFGISCGLAEAIKLFKEGNLLDNEPFAKADPALFADHMKHCDDGFEVEYPDIEEIPEVGNDIITKISEIITYIKDGVSLETMSTVLDVGSVIDLMIFTLLSQDIDAINNNYLLVSYNGKVIMSPYDMNQSFIIAGAAFAQPSAELDVTIDTLEKSALYSYILNNSDAVTALKNRFNVLRNGPLSDWAVAARLANITKYIAPQAYSAEEKRWPMYGYFNEAWSANAVIDRYRMQAEKVTQLITNL